MISTLSLSSTTSCSLKKWSLLCFSFAEYAGNIGDAKDPEAKEQEQNRILQLVDKFWIKLQELVCETINLQYHHDCFIKKK